MNKTENRPSFLFETISIALVLAFFAFFYLRPSVHFKEESRTLEKGVEYAAADFVEKANGTVVPEAEHLYTKEVGIYEFHYKVKKLFFEKDVLFAYEVVDTTPPVIEIISKKVVKEPKEEYTDEQIRSNISLNEGTFTYETDYDPYMSGSYLVNITAKDDYGNVSTASYEVNVRDVEAPVVFVDGDGAQIVTGSEVNITDLIAYGDNVDPEPVLETEGEINTSKPGSYTIHGKLTDSSSNSTEWDFTVEVADEFPPYEPSDYFYPFEDFLKDHAGYSRMFGIDVSSWQGDIDFNKVKEAGCEFVIIRVGFSYQGKFTLDNKFRQNYEGARAAGLKVGIYHFSYDNNKADLQVALDSIFAELKDDKLDLPIFFDWEDFGSFNEYKMNFKDLNLLYDYFADEVQKRGYECMLYGSQFYLDKVWAHTDTRPIWLAQYIDKPTYGGQYEIWQLSDSGRIDGIEGNVDLDIMFLRQ